MQENNFLPSCFLSFYSVNDNPYKEPNCPHLTLQGIYPTERKVCDNPKLDLER